MPTASDEHLVSLSGSMHAVSLAHGETLFRHGEPATRFFYLRSGQVKLFRVSPDGHEKIIEIIRPGQTFAEAVMFIGPQGPYPVSCEAISDCELYAFDQKAFLQVLESSHEISFGMLASMSRRLHMLVNQIESLTLQNATYRLALRRSPVPVDRKLLRLGGRRGLPAATKAGDGTEDPDR